MPLYLIALNSTFVSRLFWLPSAPAGSYTAFARAIFFAHKHINIATLPLVAALLLNEPLRYAAHSDDIVVATASRQ